MLNSSYEFIFISIKQTTNIKTNLQTYKINLKYILTIFSISKIKTFDISCTKLPENLNSLFRRIKKQFIISINIFKFNTKNGLKLAECFQWS